MQHLLYNGTLISAEPGTELSIPVSSRSFLYADGIFETLRVVRGQVLFLEDHFLRIREGLKAHRIHPPLGFTPASLTADIQKLLDANCFHHAARVRITLSRKSDGYYTPQDSGLDVCITASELESLHYTLNKSGLTTDIYPDMKCSPNPLSRFKNIASSLYVQSGIWAKSNQLDTALIQNDKMGIIESTSSNLFLVSNGVLYTPGLDSGATAGIMRAQIINIALASGMKVYECNLTPQNMLVADEVFLSNAVQGMQWVGSYRTKRYFNATTSELLGMLNDKVDGLVQA